MKDRGQGRTAETVQRFGRQPRRTAETVQVQRFGRQPRTAPAVQAVLAMASAELAERLAKEYGEQVMAMAGAELAKRLVANGTPGTGAAKAGGATQSKGHRAAKKAWATMKARESKMSEPELARLHRKRSMAAKKAWVTIRAKTA